MQRSLKLNKNKNYTKKIVAYDLKYLIINNMKFIGEAKTRFEIRPKGPFTDLVLIDILTKIDEKYIGVDVENLTILKTSWRLLYRTFSKHYKDYIKRKEISKAFKIPVFIFSKDRLNNTSMKVDKPSKPNYGFVTRIGYTNILVKCDGTTPPKVS